MDEGKVHLEFEYGQIKKISSYAQANNIDNNLEEVYTEYRTKKLLEG